MAEESSPIVFWSYGKSDKTKAKCSGTFDRKLERNRLILKKPTRRQPPPTRNQTFADQTQATAGGLHTHTHKNIVFLVSDMNANCSTPRTKTLPTDTRGHGCGFFLGLT